MISIVELNKRIDLLAKLMTEQQATLCETSGALKELSGMRDYLIAEEKKAASESEKVEAKNVSR